MRKSELTKAKDKLWKLCREIIRKIYPNECFTCRAQDLAGSNRQTGHFITSSICSMELRYDIKNLRQQCFVCNIHKSGNWPAFEARLIQDEGQEYVDALKKRNQETKAGNYGIVWIRQKTEDYKELLKTISTQEIDMEKEKQNWIEMMKKLCENYDFGKMEQSAFLGSINGAWEAAYRWGLDDKQVQMEKKIADNYVLKIPF